MLNNLTIKKEKKTAFFTIERNLMYQFVLFPLLLTVIIIVPLGIYSLVHLFISVDTRNNLQNAIILSCAGIFISFFVGFLFSRSVRTIEPKTAVLNRYLTFISLSINTVAIFIAYATSGIFSAKIAGLAVNPLFIVVNIMFESILENSSIMIMILSHISYAATFLIFTRKAFITKEKRQIRAFALFTAIIMVFSVASCSFIAYPELEYDILKKKYEGFTITDDAEYSFYENLPFDTNTRLVKSGKRLSLDFTDVYTSPRLDGATAFYPVYAAVIENCYSGLKTAVENNDLFFYSNYWGGGGGEDNIGLYIPYEQENDPLLYRCAELVSCTQTTYAYNGLAEGKSDVVFAFEPSVEQIAYAAERGVEFELTPIGYDAFCFFVNRQNPVDNLTLTEIQDIYSGKTTNWKNVGGKNKRIFAFTRPKNSGSQTIMENVVMKDIAINTKFQPKEVKTMGGIIRVVDGYLNTPAAIGYTFMYYSSFMVTGESIKYLAIDGVKPTSETVRSGAYIFSAPFYAVTIKGNKTQETQELLDWLTGQEGQSFVEQCGYVGL